MQTSKFQTPTAKSDREAWLCLSSAGMQMHGYPQPSPLASLYAVYVEAAKKTK